MRGRGWVLLLVLTVLANAAGAANGSSAERLKRMVSIPGCPLPAMDEDSVRWAIAGYEPILAGIRLFGTKSALARGIGFLATLYAAVGNASKAESLFAEAQTIMETHGSTRVDLAWLNNNHGLVQLEAGDYTRSLHSFRAALAAMTPELPDQLDPRAKILQNLATAQQFIGDFGGAEQSYLEALATLRRIGKRGVRTSQTVRSNFAALYGSVGDHERVRTMLTELLKETGLASTVRFAALNALGFSLSVLKEYGEAERCLLEANTISDEPSFRVVVLQNLSSMYFLAGNYERARQMSEEALPLAEEVHGTNSRSVAGLRATLGATALLRGDLVKADVLFTQSRKVLSRVAGDRDVLADVIRNLALVAERRGQRDRALELSSEALRIEKENFDRIIAFGSEAQRLAYRANRSPYDQLANLGQPVLLADAVLAMKGAVLESLLAERALARRNTAPDERERLDRIHVLKVEVMEKVARGEGTLDSLERELKAEESALARSVAAESVRQVRPTLASVQARLAGDEVLVEIVRFQRLEQQGKLVWSYGGLVIPHAGAPKWVHLGAADLLDAKVEQLLRALWPALENKTRGVEPLLLDESTLLTAQSLEAELWKPLQDAFPDGAKKVLVSPDGATHFVPWAALPDESGTFAAERFQIAEVASGRDLLRDSVATSQKTILAFANGTSDLPETRTEVDEIAALAADRGWRATVLEGERATETQLLEAAVPRILHFATHGGEWAGRIAPLVESRLSRNPMYRSYLLLGGAQAALELWKSEEPAPFFADGILTAEEAEGLSLKGNWLTVLSACRTGRGDSRTGEGVIGLRRGFALAGSENLVFTLADVGDEPTARFMAEFYARLLPKLDLVGAFHETQRSELVRWRDEAGAAEAIRNVGAFVLALGTGDSR